MEDAFNGEAGKAVASSRCSHRVGCGVPRRRSPRAGCSDDEESAQESYCAAGDSLESNLGALTDLDLIAEGTEGLNTAVEQVQSDLVELRESASEAAADDVSALEQSVDDLETAISSLGGDLTSDNAAAVGASIRRVGTSAQAVLATLSDC